MLPQGREEGMGALTWGLELAGVPGALGEDLGSSQWDLQGVGAWGSPEHGCDPPVSLAEGTEG